MIPLSAASPCHSIITPYSVFFLVFEIVEVMEFGLKIKTCPSMPFFIK
jgi:hypothetical protein